MENTSRWLQLLSSRLILCVVRLSPCSFASCGSCHISLSFVPLSTAAAALTRVCQTRRWILRLSPHRTAFLPPLSSTSSPGSFARTLTLSLSRHSCSLCFQATAECTLQQTELRGILISPSCLFFILFSSLSYIFVFCLLCSCTDMPCH